MLTITFIDELIRLVEESDSEGLEVSSWARTVRIIKRLPRSQSNHQHSQNPGIQRIVEGLGQRLGSEYLEIRSPMVGTFYWDESKGEEPGIRVGDEIREGQTVAYIEATRLMTAIESGCNGIVSKVVAENNRPFGYGQVLFEIDVKN
jgi:biotin carboxyl carrier protein